MADASAQKTLAPEGGQVSRWLARPFQLVSLLEMITFHAKNFVEVIRCLEVVQTSARSYKDDEQIEDEEIRVAYLSQLKRALYYCQKMRLDFSVIYINLVISNFMGYFKDDFTYGEFEKE